MKLSKMLSVALLAMGLAFCCAGCQKSSDTAAADQSSFLPRLGL